MLESDVGSVVLEVLLDLDLVHLSADGVERVATEQGAVDLLVVGLEEEHVLLEDAHVLEAG